MFGTTPNTFSSTWSYRDSQLQVGENCKYLDIEFSAVKVNIDYMWL